MSGDDDLTAALADLARSDVDGLLDDVRRDGLTLARRRLAEAYADALVAAVARRRHDPEPASTDASRLPPSTPPNDNRGCYLYAIVAGAGAGAATGEPGVLPGGPVETVTVDGLTAVVSDVDVEALRAGCDEADVSETGWLANAVRAHERVVVAAFHSAPTLPIRFGVVHPDRDAAARVLREHGPDIRAELDRLAGTAEWNLRVVADAAAVERHVGAGDAPAMATTDGVTDGRSFLLRERARRDVGAQVRRFLADRGDELAAALEPLVLDRAELPRAGGDTPTLFAAACLVARQDEQRLRAAADRFATDWAGAGVSVSLDGPWPPFHFTSLRVVTGDG